MKSISNRRFFDDAKNVEEYIVMYEGMDGSALIEILKTYLIPGSSVLELGMGPGTDLDILSKTFKTTGSDSSQVFLDIYQKNNPDADLRKLDAASLNTEGNFDCIFSNKVLHHIERKHLSLSFEKQLDLLNDNGILFHTFWRGDEENEFEDLKFIKYHLIELENLTKPFYDLVASGTYAEMNQNDSIYLVLRKK